MTDIIKTDTGNIGAGSRKRFMRRYKDQIKERLKERIDATKIKDVSKKRKVRVVTKSMDEPHYEYDPMTGRKEYVGNSNDVYKKGDRSKKDTQKSQQAQSGAGHGEDDYGDFIFELTKEELVEFLFEDLELPDYIKEGLKSDSCFKMVRRGQTVDGIPVNINPVKTIMAAMARKVAYKGAMKKKIEAAKTEEEKEELRNKKAPYLEDTDLRYKRYDKVSEPIRNATMILLMDVSGSMSQKDRDMAKRFFMLLYLFLERSYANVNLRFVTYTDYAEEVDEEEFFHGRRYGGTSVLAATNKVDEVIKSLDLQKDNIYLAHVSDGDMDTDELDEVLAIYAANIMPSIQYAAYVELADRDKIQMMGETYGFYTPVSAVYISLKEKFQNIGNTWADEHDKIFAALQDLFRRK